jgi:hypothetical protein
MIPSIQRKEWLELIMGSFDPPISSHLLKIRINTLRKKVKRKLVTPETAVNELYDDCKKHQDIYKNDLFTIFKRENANLS